MEPHRTPNGDPRRTDPQYRRPADDDRRVSAERETRDGSSGLGWLWALPLAALAGLGWYLLRGTPAEHGDVTATREIVAPTGAAAVAALPDLQRQTTSAIQSLTGALQGITDRATATTALPKMQETAKDMDRLALQSVQLPADARTTLANVTREPISKLNTLMDTAANLPGVGPVLQPVMASLRGRMDAIAMMPGKPLFYASAPSDWVAVSSFYNREVFDRAGERVGTASGFYVAPDGKIVASILSVDRQLGIGDKQVAMPFGNGQLVRKNDGWHLMVDTTKDDLQRAKSFETGK